MAHHKKLDLEKSVRVDNVDSQVQLTDKTLTIDSKAMELGVCQLGPSHLVRQNYRLQSNGIRSMSIGSKSSRQNKCMLVILACMHSSTDVMHGQLDISSIYVIRQLWQLFASRTVHTSKNNACKVFRIYRLDKVCKWPKQLDDVIVVCARLRTKSPRQFASLFTYSRL